MASSLIMQMTKMKVTWVVSSFLLVLNHCYQHQTFFFKCSQLPTSALDCAQCFSRVPITIKSTLKSFYSHFFLMCRPMCWKRSIPEHMWSIILSLWIDAIQPSKFSSPKSIALKLLIDHRFQAEVLEDSQTLRGMFRHYQILKELLFLFQR